MNRFKLLLTAIGLLCCMGIHAYEYVDLGLPSGTLWATTNVGAATESDYGSYFAWGETATKATYSQVNYTLASGITEEGQWNASYMTKYTSTDGITTLASTDDAATVACGSTWVTPTTTQFQELIDNCTWTAEGNGYRVSGNGKSIFLPFAGSKYDGQGASGTHNAAVQGCYMANSVNTSGYGEGKILSIASGSKAVSNYSRFYGISVRPVSTTAAVRETTLTLDKTALTLAYNEGVTLKATTNSTSTVTWESSAPTKVHVDDAGHVSAVAFGEATITASVDGLSTTCTVTVGWNVRGRSEVYCIDGMYYTLSGTNASVTYATTSYNSYSGDIIIPETISFRGNKYIINCIGDNAFRDCTGLTSIIIPESVIEIGEMSFRGCTALEKVEIKGCTKIDDSAFETCSSLANLEMSDVVSIGNGAFYGCTELTKIGNLLSCTSIGGSAFSECNKLEEIGNLPLCVTIGGSAFENCYKLKSIGDLSACESVGAHAFDNMTKTSISYSRNYTRRYYNSLNINVINVDKWVKNSYINNYLNDICNRTNFKINGEDASKVKIVISEGVDEISRYSLQFSNIAFVHIPSTVNTILDNTFPTSTTNTLKIEIAKIEPIVLSSINSVNNECVIYVPKSSVSTYREAENWISHSSQIIPLGCKEKYEVNVKADDTKSIIHTTIGESNLINVTELKISGTINAYDLMIMQNKMNNLKELDLTNARILTKDYEYYSGYTSVADTWTRYAFPRTLSTLKLPSTLKQINSYAMVGFSRLKNLVIPNSVTTIEANAANGNTTTDITFEDNSNLESLGESAFYGCTKITDINLGANKLTSIPASAFYKCSSLVRYTIPANITMIGNDAFVLCDALKDLIINDSEMPLNIASDLNCNNVAEVYLGRNISSSSKIFRYHTSLSKVTIGDKVTSLNNSLFYGCTNITTVEGDLSNIETIGTYTFYNCQKLSSFTFNDKISAIPDYAFGGCIALENITIPTNITSIGQHAFDGCSALKTVVLPANSLVADIPTYAFANCSSLEKMNLPTSVKTIGAYAFMNCTSMSEVKISSAVNSIGDKAFYGCSKLFDVYTYTIEPQTIDQNTFSTYTAATLHCPAASYYNYFYDTQWSQFLKLVNFDDPYDYVYIAKDFEVETETAGTINGEPQVDINTTGSVTVNGNTNQAFGDVHIKVDATSSASLIGNNNLTAANVYVDIDVVANKWYFFCFPYDVDLTKVQKEGQYIFRLYDGDKRAANGYGSAWQDVLNNKLNAGEGYIFRTNKAGVLSVKFEAPNLSGANVTTALVAHDNGTTANEHKNWNFSGNRYISYYEINDLDYTAPVTVWDASTETYTAYRPGDDDFTLAPFQAFFVQKPNAVDGVGFDKNGRTTYLKDKDKKEKGESSNSKARKAAKLNSDREIININISDGTNTDKTRVVFNEKQSMNYEMECDACKFTSIGVPQLYSLDTDGVKYSINERPKMNGEVQLGFIAPNDGEYTFTATRMDIPAYIKDNETGKIYDLANSYTFTAKAGTYKDRFVLTLSSGSEATRISTVRAKDIDIDAIIYDLAGRRINEVTHGVFIVNGKKMYVK